MALNAPFVATNTAPTGAENTGVVRAIARKNSTFETTSPLAASAAFVGPWHDSQADGTAYVILTSLSNQASAASGLILQESENLANASFTRSVLTSGGAISANVLSRVGAAIKARYWRVSYTNGVTAQASFVLVATALSYVPTTSEQSNSTNTNFQAQLAAVGIANQPNSTDNLANTLVSAPALQSTTSAAQSNAGPMTQAPYVFGGAFSGSSSAALQNWSRARTPTVFNSAQATASGDTAVWTPGSSNKFRILKYQIEVTANAAISGGGAVLTVKLRDATTDLNLTHDIWIPTTSVTTTPGDGYVSGWQDLGQFGALSAAANNVLNVNLSATLTSGNVRVRVAGTEE